METVYIYGLFDPRNLKLRYIGQTGDISKRLKSHIKSAKFNKKPLHRNNWINQLLNEGLEPAIEVLEECTGDNWKEAEKAWIREAREKGLKLTNIVEGGEGFGSGEKHPLFGKHLTEEHKRKIADKVKGENNGFYGKRHSEETLQHYRDLFTGQKVPRERVYRTSQKLKGRVKSDEERQRISKALTGRKFSDEHKKNISEAAKKRGYSKEAIAKMAQINTGSKHSEETIAKQRLARLKYWERKKTNKQ